MFNSRILGLQALIGCAMAYTLPSGSGHLSTHISQIELTDISRQDPYNTSSSRRLMATRFDPVPFDHCNQTIQVPYMTRTLAESIASIIPNVPPSFLTNFTLTSCVQTSPQDESYPWVLLSHGLAANRFLYSTLAQDLASHGFTVISVDHPGTANLVEFLNGDIAQGGAVNGNSTMQQSEEAIAVRAADLSFVLTSLAGSSGSRALVVGHSFGGGTAAAVLDSDKRFIGGINLDGQVYEPVRSEGIGAPNIQQSLLLIGADVQRNSSNVEDPQLGGLVSAPAAKFASWNSIRSTFLGRNAEFFGEMRIVNTTHFSFTDIPTLIDVAGIRSFLSEETVAFVGSIPGPRFLEVFSFYAIIFFNIVLGKEGERHVFEAPTEKFGDVNVERVPIWLS